MIAHNLCYTTQCDPSHPQAVIMPTGAAFVSAETQKGVLPQILEELLLARKQAKREMTEEKDPFVKAVLNGRQLALKITANSLYGYTGAGTSQLPSLAISSTVTAIGRSMIDDTKTTIESVFSLGNGYPCDAEVIYGVSFYIVFFVFYQIAETNDYARKVYQMSLSHGGRSLSKV